MKTINRLMINISSEKLEESKEFYTSLFDFEIAYDSDWFIHLLSKEKGLELGIINKTSEIKPPSISRKVDGMYLTFVVDDTNEIFEMARSQGFTIVEEPKDTSYGQRRLLVQDPNGVVIDVSSPIPDFQFSN